MHAAVSPLVSEMHRTTTMRNGLSVFIRNSARMLAKELEEEKGLARDLNVNSAYFAGAEKQLLMISAIADELQEVSSQLTPLLVRDLLQRLSRAYSLSPRSATTRRLIDDVFISVNQDALASIALEAKNRIILHVSCASRLEQAKASVQSFQPINDEEFHLIVIGDDEGDSDIQIGYADQILTVPTWDCYEGLARKVAFSCFIMNIVAPNSLIAKFDDDVRLVRRATFMDLMARIDESLDHYLGFPITIDHHKHYWHGWHQGKCRYKQNEDVGLCFPVPKAFANGGAGYFLKPAAVRIMAYAFLAQSFILESPSGWAEDVITGLLLENNGISLASLGEILRTATGYTSQEEKRRLQEGDSWTIYQNRLSGLGRE